MRCNIARIVRVCDTRTGLELQVVPSLTSVSLSAAYCNSTRGRLYLQFCLHFCVFWSGLILPSILTSWHFGTGNLPCKIVQLAVQPTPPDLVDLISLQIVEAEMFYDFLFEFFDSIPTVTFIAWFTPIYFSLHFFAFRLFLLHPRFRGVSLDKQTFILINLMESLLLALMRYTQHSFFWYCYITFQFYWADGRLQGGCQHVGHHEARP